MRKHAGSSRCSGAGSWVRTLILAAFVGIEILTHSRSTHTPEHLLTFTRLDVMVDVGIVPGIPDCPSTAARELGSSWTDDIGRRLRLGMASPVGSVARQLLQVRPQLF